MMRFLRWKPVRYTICSEFGLPWWSCFQTEETEDVSRERMKHFLWAPKTCFKLLIDREEVLCATLMVEHEYRWGFWPLTRIRKPVVVRALLLAFPREIYAIPKSVIVQQGESHADTIQRFCKKHGIKCLKRVDEYGNDYVK